VSARTFCLLMARHKSRRAFSPPHCPLLTDAVDKVGDERRAGNNRIQVPSFLNLYCAPGSYLDSMLLTRPSKNVYRQHRPRADVLSRAFTVSLTTIRTHHYQTWGMLKPDIWFQLTDGVAKGGLSLAPMRGGHRPLRGVSIKGGSTIVPKDSAACCGEASPSSGE
jgi:hypothetical protein